MLLKPFITLMCPVESSGVRASGHALGAAVHKGIFIPTDVIIIRNYALFFWSTQFKSLIDLRAQIVFFVGWAGVKKKKKRRNFQGM